MIKILIIEDELSYLKLMRSQLIKNGYTVIEATDGKEGLALAKAQHPDMILLDIKMPIMDGISMLGKLRKDTFGKLIKVIILTNIEPDDKILQKVIRDQPYFYFIKNDIQLSELIDKIKELTHSTIQTS